MAFNRMVLMKTAFRHSTEWHWDEQHSTQWHLGNDIQQNKIQQNLNQQKCIKWDDIYPNDTTENTKKHVEVLLRSHSIECHSTKCHSAVFVIMLSANLQFFFVLVSAILLILILTVFHSDECHYTMFVLMLSTNLQCCSAMCLSDECHSAESHSTECYSAKCYSAECHSAECHSDKMPRFTLLAPLRSN
jgi:hypothetical protein